MADNNGLCTFQSLSPASRATLASLCLATLPRMQAQTQHELDDIKQKLERVQKDRQLQQVMQEFIKQCHSEAQPQNAQQAQPQNNQQAQPQNYQQVQSQNNQQGGNKIKKRKYYRRQRRNWNTKVVNIYIGGDYYDDYYDDDDYECNCYGKCRCYYY